MKHTAMMYETQIQLYPSTAFFTGFSATVITDTALNQQMRFYEGEKIIVTDTSDADHWTVVPVTNPARYGQIQRRHVMTEDVRREPWFFPELPGNVTTAALKRQGPGSFLLRTQKKKFLLSHMSERNVYHTWIHQSESGRFYVDSRRRFSSIQELIDFCRRNRVNGMRIEKYPTKQSIEDLWFIDTKLDEFKCQREISGHFPWTIKLGNLKTRGQVALHVLKKSALVDDENWLRRQTQVLMSLEHENLVELAATCRYNERPALALRLHSTETLSDHLKHHAHTLLTTPTALLTMGGDVSAAMMYLERRGIVHNELVSDNCWVEMTSRRIRVGGFHLARFEEDPQQTVARYQSRVPIPAPEIQDGGVSSGMTDVWAYGLLLWKLFAGKDGHKQITMDKVLSRPTPPGLSADVSDLVEGLVTSCLYDMAQIRPSFHHIHKQISHFLQHTQNDVTQPSIDVDPVLFGIETYELPNDTLNESNTYFDGENQQNGHPEQLDLYELTNQKTEDKKPNEDSFWSSEDPFDTGSPEFDVTKPTSAKRQLTFEEDSTPKRTPGVSNNNYVSSDSGCSLSQNNLRRIRSVGDEYQNLRSLCRTYREMFEKAKTENDALQRRIDELEHRTPVVELEERLKDIEHELNVSQRECKRLRDRNKMLERSFCQQCKGSLNVETKSESENKVTFVTSEERIPSSLSVESGGTIRRGMTQFEKENLARRQRLQTLRLNTSNVTDSSLEDTLPSQDDVTHNMTSSDIENQFCSSELALSFKSSSLENSRSEFGSFRQHSDDSAVDFGSSRTESCDSGSVRQMTSRTLVQDPEVRAAQKLIRDNLQHSYLTSHTHISTIAEDGVSKVTLF